MATILSEGDAAGNESKFKGLLNQDTVLFVVQGSKPESEGLFEIANGLGTGHRGVVWAKNPSDIANVVSGLSSSVNPPPSENDLGFTVSLTNVIRDVIRADEETPDEVRVFEAYANAENDQ
ncbi:hypothetical protein IIA28_12585 [candidate division KSB1 bacterium]|nr:hypothetical protein [candidate division KSB1 bacterium]